METITIPTANALPAPTWHRLHVNDVEIELPANLQEARQVEASAGEPTSAPTTAAHQANDQASLTAAKDEGVATPFLSKEKNAATPHPIAAASPRPVAAGELWDEALMRAADTEVSRVEPISAPTTAAHQVNDQALLTAATKERATAEDAPASASATVASASAISSASSATAEGTMDDVALSDYQVASLEARYLSPADTFATGMGPDASEYLEFVADEPLVFATEPGEHTCATVRLEGIDNSVNAAAIDVIAAPNSQLSLAIALDSPTLGTGVVGTRLRVFADKNAQVNVTTTQTLDDTWIALDDTGALLAEGAHLNVRHTVLGAGRAYTGLAADLRGDDAHLNVTTRYAGQTDQLRDFNYAVTQRGRRTRANLEANGVLAGASQKTLRGTIDLVHGCKGSEGSERETVLLADERVENRTVPVILCSEDDVAGNHGATIGHVRPEQLFYLASRGIAPEAAERLFMVAAFEQAALEAPDPHTREAVTRLATTRNIELDLSQQEVTA